MMDFNKYQQLAKRTDEPHENKQIGLINATMGMVGEAAETLEHMKKVIFQGHELDGNKLIEEAGDCLWYIAKLARYCDVTLEEIAQKNIEKLRKRYPKGFKAEHSINRKI